MYSDVRPYLREKASAYEGKGEFKEALKWYNRIIELSPDHTVGYILKGSCFVAAGQYDLAKREFLTAIKLEGNPEEAYYNLALLSRAEMKFEEAKAYCEKSLEIDPEDPSVIHCYQDILAAIQLTIAPNELSPSHSNDRQNIAPQTGKVKKEEEY